MVYLYAGLGVAMLAGIMAIFEMGLALTGRSLLPMPLDTYRGSLEQSLEQELLGNSSKVKSGSQGEDICDDLSKDLPSGQSPSRIFTPNTLDSSWDQGCVMEYSSHQVLVVPDSSGGSVQYLIFSCTAHDSSSLICPFEEKQLEGGVNNG